MVLQVLSPSVQHAEKTDFGAQVFRIGANLDQRVRAGLIEKVID